MSEYQYYEFRAVERPLDASEMRELRSVSSRASITPTRFVNHYEWGDFKGDPSVWVERYFDAFLYFANWGTRLLTLRLLRRAADPVAVQAYCRGELARARVTGEFLILEFGSDAEDDEGDLYASEDDELDDGKGWLADLLPLRAEIAGGDHRALYLAWLLCVARGDLDEQAAEPPVPPGLAALSGAQRAFADFLRVDDDLIAVAAERSPPIEDAGSRAALEGWIAALPESEKTALLIRLAGDGPSARADLLRRFRRARPPAEGERPPRTVADLTAAAARLAAERERRLAERAARERARHEREEAAKRARYLDSLVGREPELWRQIDALVATARPNDYDRAVALIRDLHDLGLREGRPAEVADRVRALRARHARKPRFLDRLAGVLADASA